MPRVHPVASILLLFAALLRVTAARGLRPRNSKMFIARAARPALQRPARRWLRAAAAARSRKGLLQRGGRKAALATSADVPPDPSTYARVALILEDGFVFEAKSFGAESGYTR